EGTIRADVPHASGVTVAPGATVGRPVLTRVVSRAGAWFAEPRRWFWAVASFFGATLLGWTGLLLVPGLVVESADGVRRWGRAVARVGCGGPDRWAGRHRASGGPHRGPSAGAGPAGPLPPRCLRREDRRRVRARPRAPPAPGPPPPRRPSRARGGLGPRHARRGAAPGRRGDLDRRGLSRRRGARPTARSHGRTPAKLGALTPTPPQPGAPR